MRVEALSGAYFESSNNHYSPNSHKTAEQAFITQECPLPYSKEEFREHRKTVSPLKRAVDLGRAETDVQRGVIDALDLNRQILRSATRDEHPYGRRLIIGGGFLTIPEIYIPTQIYLSRKNIPSTVYQFRAEDYPYKKAPAGFVGANIEPLEWQVPDFSKFVVEVSERDGEPVDILAQSKGGHMAILAMLDSDVRSHVAHCITVGSPIPEPNKINSSVGGAYLRALDYFEADDFKFAQQINKENLKDVRNVISIINPNDPIVGGTPIGKVYETDVAHSGMLHNVDVLDFAVNELRQPLSIHVQNGHQPLAA